MRGLRVGMAGFDVWFTAATAATLGALKVVRNLTWSFQACGDACSPAGLNASDAPQRACAPNVAKRPTHPMPDHPYRPGTPRHVRSSSALVTTLTLENAIAAPASIGFSQPKAASGMPIRL